MAKLQSSIDPGTAQRLSGSTSVIVSLVLYSSLSANISNTHSRLSTPSTAHLLVLPFTMLDRSTRALQPDLEQKDLAESLVSLSISLNGHITASARHREPACPHNSGTGVIPPPAPIVLPPLRVRPALAVPVRRPRAVSSPTAPSPPIIAIYVPDEAADSKQITINIAIRPRSQSTTASPLPPSSASSAVPTPSKVKCSAWAPSRGRQCHNSVPWMPLSYIHPDDIRPEEGDIPHFCNVHYVVHEYFYPPKAGGMKVKFAGD